MPRLGLAWALVALGGCGGPRIGAEVFDSGLAEEDEATFTRVQTEVLTPSCASSACHAGSPPPVAPMSLEANGSYSELVGVPSRQSALNRVAPGSPDSSYLMLKLRGLGGNAGGVATRMPLGADPLSESSLALVERWILRGAPND